MCSLARAGPRESAMEDPSERRARLKALKEAAALADGAAVEPATAAEPEKPMLKFRNYAVKDEKNIAHERVAPAQPPQFQQPIAEKKAEEAPQEDVLLNVAPKKANWDLKRDVEKKLAKLERRTQRAILEIMQHEEDSRAQVAQE